MTALIELTAFATKSIRLSNGITLPYVEQGDPDGTPVLFLHGFSDSWHSYELVLPYLPPSIRAIALTQRGHGDATRPESGYTPVDMAGDAAQVIEELGLGSAVVVGHSMGATVTQRFAIDYPELARGIVLLGSVNNLDQNPGVGDLVREIDALFKEDVPAFARAFQESTLARPIPAWYLDLVVAESTKLPVPIWRAVIRDLVTGAVKSKDLAAISAPTLMIWGDQDAFIELPEQRILTRTLPNAAFLVYAGAGHALHWEDPARTAADIVAFVERLTG
jgi:non-heme chloroperoxidase